MSNVRDINTLRNVLFEIIQGYFGGAVVLWAEQKSVKTDLPLIRLKLKSLSHPSHYINVNENDASKSYIPATMRLEVQLFTHGDKQITTEGQEEYEIAVNTAVADIEDLTMFLTSQYADSLYELYDIAIRKEGNAIDVSAVQDNRYEYRAMQEYLVDFIMSMDGFAGISRPEWQQTPSGGGTLPLASIPIDEVDADTLEIEEDD